MFNAMMEAFMEEVVGFLFNLQVEVTPVRQQVGVVTDEEGAPVEVGAMLAARGLQRPKGPDELTYTSPGEDGGQVTSKKRQQTGGDQGAAQSQRPVPPDPARARKPKSKPKKRKRRR